eukprot:TRINITY_DN22507_c0_g2_i1.p2 TRINITY_DN22507_c0_g2~~TRINITY_DN22507_c0_g2_i1.p2  ORF type:complete len:124 (+),score=21.66 TRINITY_DN22507_c0_g2_i1:178-549(+)
MGTSGSSTASSGLPGAAANDPRDAQYAACMMGLDKILADWENQLISNDDAAKQADHLMERIRQISQVNTVNAKRMLDERGLTDERRALLEASYRRLKEANGHHVAYGSNSRRPTSSGHGFCGC